MAMNPQPAKAITSGTRIATASNVAIMVIVAAAIVIFVNYLFGPERFRTRFDWTSTGDNTLSDKSLKLLAALPDKLGKDERGRERNIEFVSIFERPRSQVDLKATQMVQNLVQVYKLNARNRIAYSEFNGVTDVSALLAKMQELKIKEPSAGLLVALGDRVRTIALEDMVKIRRSRGMMFGGDDEGEGIEENRIEDAITTNLLALLDAEKPKIYFLTGHGEPEIHDTNKDGVSRFADALRQNGYDVEPLDLSEKGGVPPDTRAIVWIGANRPVPPKELAALKSYAHRGGRFIVAIEPVAEASKDADVLSFLAEFAIKSPEGILCELIPDPLTGRAIAGVPDCAGAVRVRSNDFSSANPITKSFFEQRLSVPFPESRCLERILDGDSKATVEDLARTGKSTWLDLAPFDFAPAEGEKTNEPFGARTVMAAGTLPNEGPASQPSSAPSASETSKHEGRVVAFGSTSIARNIYFEVGRDLYLSSVEWLSGREFAAGIGPRPMKKNALVDNSQILPKIVGAGFVLTGLAIFLAGTIWRVRRGVFVGLVASIAVGAVPFLFGMVQLLFT
jgi:hypothetical protein